MESQQEDAARTKTRGPEPTPEERERFHARVRLELARTQTTAELATASRPPHRDMLRQRLAAIDEALAKLA